MPTTKAQEGLLPPLSLEYASSDFGDQRLSVRLWRIVDALMERPAATFPDALGDEASLEAFYRFVNNARVTPEAILGPHLEETCARATELQTVLAVHDTTEVEYKGEFIREGLGPVSGTGQGYFAHVALAVGANGLREPLGVLGALIPRRSSRARKALGSMFP